MLIGVINERLYLLQITAMYDKVAPGHFRAQQTLPK